MPTYLFEIGKELVFCVKFSLFCYLVNNFLGGIIALYFQREKRAYKPKFIRRKWE
jgi:hypothetical protein